MSIDEQHIRERLAMIVAEVDYAPDTTQLMGMGQRLRRRRKVVGAASAGVLLAVLVTVGLSVVMPDRGRIASPPAVTGTTSPPPATGEPPLAPLADVSATPSGWSPVAYRDGQVSVPSGWFIENPEYTCGQHDAGRVFIDEPARRPAAGMGCGRAENIITIRSASTAAIPHARTRTINQVTVQFGWSRHGDHTTYVERGLGLDITATGPAAQRVLNTITHSPLSVVLNSTGLATPPSWTQVTFGGLQFAVPPHWRRQHMSWWGGCPYNLTRNLLVLSTAQKLFFPGCPPPPSTAHYLAGVPGMVVGAGPKITGVHPSGSTCLTSNRLRICINPPPLHGGYRTDSGLQILTARVYLPSQQRPDWIEIGLSGSGQTAAQIFESLKPAR